MNKHLYRVIFNKARGLLVVVAEIARAQGKGSGNDNRGKVCQQTQSQPLFFALPMLPIAIGVALGSVLLTMSPAHAEVIADPSAPKTQQATVLRTGNGLLLVNIQTPSAAGVSRNVYSALNVPREGAVFNNSRTNVQTQLGGWVSGNPWLATGSARIILNEVNSSSPSLLQGYMEIAGQRAQMVIVNPSGITCDGCGFINTSRGTLTTGAPILNGGALEGYRVQQGVITIQGKGLDASQTDYTDIIARAVEVNAGIWANELTVTAGTNEVDADNTTAMPIAASTPTPTVAIDVSNLGGMYAGKIHLVATEAGVGVRNAGKIGASAGGFTLSANGRLENTGSINSTDSTRITLSDHLSNTGTLYAQSDLSLTTQGNINNSGVIAAKGSATLNANGVNSLINSTATSVLAAGLNDDGTLLPSSAAKLSIHASRSISAQGQNLSANNQQMTSQTIDISNSQTVGSNLHITASNGSIDARSAVVAVTTNLTTEATQSLITDDARLSAQQLTITARDISNVAGEIQATGDAHLSSDRLDNQSGKITVGKTLTINSAQTINNTSGTMASNENASIHASSITNFKGVIASVESSVDITATGEINNTQGLLSAVNTLTIADSVAVLGSNELSKTLAVINTDGTIIADNSLRIDSASLTGDGEIISGGDVSTLLRDDFTQIVTATFQANGDVLLETRGTLTNQGALHSAQNISLKASNINNIVAAEISAGNNTTLSTGDTLTNRGLINGSDTFIDTATLNNLGTGQIYGDHIAIQANELFNDTETLAGITSAAVIAARSQLDIGATTISNREHAILFSVGDMAIGGSLDVNHLAIGSGAILNNNSATIEALGSLTLNVGQINNTNEHFSTAIERVSTEAIKEYRGGGSANRYKAGTSNLYTYKGCHEDSWCLHTPDGGNYSNFYTYNYNRVITETQIENTDPSQILAGGEMYINANTLRNNKSNIIAGGALTANVDTLTNTEVAGEKITTDTGTVTYTSINEHTFKDDNSNFSTTRYFPAAVIQSISLTPTRYEQNTAPTSSGTHINVLSTNNVTQSSSSAGSPSSLTTSNPPSPSTIPAITSLPNNSLFQIQLDPASQYLIETDPQFASYRTWLSSDYMLNALSYAPALTQKRLGDGFYEQRLIREQVAQLTGRRFLTGYANEETQYQALMTHGVTSAQQFNLTPGIALSAEQVAALTSDIVWLVEKTITLDDGSQVQALVPQVYVRLKEGDLSHTGALVSADSINLNITDDLSNSGTIAGRTTLLINADNINNIGGRIRANTSTLLAQTDINNIGGTIMGRDALILQAARDITVETTTNTQTNGQGSRTNINRIAGLYISNPNGLLLASAGNDITLIAAELRNEGEKGQTTLQSGRDINLATVTTASREAIVWDANNKAAIATSREIGTAIASEGDITFNASRDMTIRAATIKSTEGRLDLQAGNDIVIEAGLQTQALDERHKHKSKGFLSSKTTTTHDTLNATSSVGSILSADSIDITSNNDITIEGSNVIGTHDVNLSATGDVNILAAQETHSETHYKKTKKSGLLGTGGIGFTIGTRQQSVANEGQQVTNVGSTVGSINNDVNITAGKRYSQIGSDLLSPAGNINISAQQVDIMAAEDTGNNQQTTKFKQSGITVALTSPVISAIQTAQHMSKAASQTEDTRMKALAAGTAALAINNAYDAVAAGQGISSDANMADNVGGINVSISLGSSKSESTTTQTSSTVASSTVMAGGDVNITASGAQQGSDINIIGSTVSAGNTIQLIADDQINLLAAQNTVSLRSDNESSSASVGIGFSLGGASNGFTLNLGVSGARGDANGDDIVHRNTAINAGNDVQTRSGTDTTLKGASIEAEHVIIEVGTNGQGNFNIESLQDVHTYDSEQDSFGVGVSLCIPPFCYGSSTANVSAASSDVDSDYASVNEQSGIMAGEGGFQINVAGNTNLKGAVIASNDHAIENDKNNLTTQTLTVSDIQNRAEATASSSGISLSSDMLTQGKYGVTKELLSNTLNNGEASDSSSGRTLSAVSAGAVVIIDETDQFALTGKTTEATISTLNRDTRSANIVAQYLDVEQLKQTAEAERVIKEQSIKAITAFTDEAYRSRFQVTPKLIKVECPAGVDCQANPKLLVRGEATPEDIAQAPAGSILAVNGILNDEQRGAELAYQNAVPVINPETGKKDKPSVVYLMHIAPAANTLSELLGVAYEKIVSTSDYGLANFLGYTNGQELYADLLKSRDQQLTESLAHSRGSLIQDAAFTILGNRPDENGTTYTNPNLTVRAVGGAADAVSYTDKAAVVQGPLGNKNKITYNYYTNDPVATSIFSGGNPGIWSLNDLWQVIDSSNSMHSCYGTGAAGCTQVEIPVPGGPQGTPEGNAKLIRYKGGEQVDANGDPMGGLK